MFKAAVVGDISYDEKKIKHINMALLPGVWLLPNLIVSKSWLTGDYLYPPVT